MAATDPQLPKVDPSIWATYKSLFWSVYAPGFLMSLCQGSVILIIPLFALDLGASAAITALVFSLRGLGNMTVDIPAGWATGKFGDKTVMLLSVGLMAVSALVASQANTTWQLGLAAFAFGAAVASWLLARLTHVSEAVPTHQRGKAISTMAGVQRFGNLIGPATSGIVAQIYGFEVVFYGIAVVATTALLLVMFAVKVNNRSDPDEHGSILTMAPTILMAHRRVFATAGFAIWCLTILRATRSLMLPVWGNAIGLDTSTIGFVVSLSAAIDMLMFPLAGIIMDTWGRRPAAISCLSIMSVGMLMLPFTDSFFSMAIAGLVAGAGNGLGSGINMTLGSDFAPEGRRGEFLGVWRLLSDTGSMIGPMAVGATATWITLSSAFYLSAGVGGLGVIIMWFLVDETLTKRPKQALSKHG
jgi:MFS family permease